MSPAGTRSGTNSSQRPAQHCCQTTALSLVLALLSPPLRIGFFPLQIAAFFDPVDGYYNTNPGSVLSLTILPSFYDDVEKVQLSKHRQQKSGKVYWQKAVTETWIQLVCVGAEILTNTSVAWVQSELK